MLTSQERKSLERLNFTFKKLSGEKSTKVVKNQGIDFKQLRDYVYGDDIRSIDWKSSARVQKMIVKEFSENVSSSLYILLDITKSTKLGVDFCKSDILKKTAYALAYAGISKKLPVFLATMDDELSLFKIKQESDIAIALESNKGVNTSFVDFMSKSKSGILFVVSDFLDDRLIDLQTSGYIIGLRYREFADVFFSNYFASFRDPENNKNFGADFSGVNSKKITEQIKEWWDNIDQKWLIQKRFLCDLSNENNQLVNNLVYNLRGKI